MLMYIYANTNNLQDPDNAQLIHSDPYMTSAFGGQIFATFYMTRNEV